MDTNTIQKILQDVREGRISLEEAVSHFKAYPYQDLGFARVDHHRALRHGFPEVVWGEGKTAEQISDILGKLDCGSLTVIASRVDAAKGEHLAKIFSHGRYLAVPRLFVLEKERPSFKTRGNILVVSAGTADLPVAEEAYWTAHYMGNETGKLYDVGVSGLHRLLPHVEEIQKASVVIVVAGMEGALVPVVAGMAGVPVIGVPTSVGYGVSLSGLTPLFAMLSSCASGVTVVNIDNGFGAAYAASLINRL